MLIFTAVLLILLRRRSKNAPESVGVDEKSIHVEDEIFDFKDLKKVKLTSLTIKEEKGRIYTTQRYLTLYTYTGKKKYWLGNRFHGGDISYSRFSKALIESLRRENVEFELCRRMSILAM